jgi:long-subunit fatty acid transport protein
MKKKLGGKQNNKAVRGCLSLVASLLSLMLSSAHAQQSDVERLKEVVVTPVSISSAPRPVGSGARALGMSAFTAVADDATAASWNPAGLIQLERPEVSGVFSYLSRSEDFTSADPGLDVTPADVTSSDLNYLSGVLPFRLFKTNFVASVNLQQVYSFDRQLDFTYTSRSRNVTTEMLPMGIGLRTAVDSETVSEIDFTQSGSIYAITPALAVQITPRLSVGGALNFYRNSLSNSNTFTETTDVRWRQATDIRLKILGLQGAVQPEPMSIYSEGEQTEVKEFSDVEGANVTLGTLWNVTGKLALGLTADLPYTLDMKEKVSLKAKPTRTVDQDGKVTMSRSPYEKVPEVESNVEYDFPLTLGLGAAYRFSDAFSIAGDVSWTNWSEFMFRKEDGTEVNPINQDTTTDDGTLDPVSDTWAVRLGAEYLFILKKTVIPLRAGVFLEQQPGVNDADDVYGASLGTGVSIGNVILDVAYQARFGNDVLGGVFSNVEGTDADTVEHLAFASVIVHF